MIELPVSRDCADKRGKIRPRRLAGHDDLCRVDIVMLRAVQHIFYTFKNLTKMLRVLGVVRIIIADIGAYIALFRPTVTIINARRAPAGHPSAAMQINKQRVLFVTAVLFANNI